MSRAEGTVPAVFVAHRLALADCPGGLQICTREFQQTLTAAGFNLRVVAIDHDRTVRGRLRKRIGRDAYPIEWQADAVDLVAAAARNHDARIVFLNLVNLAPMAVALRPMLDTSCDIVLLSHGLESVDFLHEQTGNRAAAATALGKLLFLEREQRRYINRVVCVNPFEVEIERWLGAQHVDWVPRTIAAREPLAWTPQRDRLGFVGTVDHPPNRDSLCMFLDALSTESQGAAVRVRVVGGPENSGRALAAAYDRVDYLGPLDDAALDSEASSWSAAVHPLFCWARGVSTKLATALAWRIPVVTTPAGARGYIWREGGPTIEPSAIACARAALALLDPSAGLAARQAVAAAVETSPTVLDVSAQLRAFLRPEGGGAA
jgi:glycosyltransferase involved in cell wall biosynthesis